MNLGSIESGVVRTLRYYRGSKVIQNKHGAIVGERNPKGGITFLFEIDYNRNKLYFTAAIAREDQQFSYEDGRKECDLNFCEAIALASMPPIVKEVYRALSGIQGTKVFHIELSKGAEPLIDQVHSELTRIKNIGELKHPFLKTLLKRMNTYNAQNADTEDFLDIQAQSNAIEVLVKAIEPSQGINVVTGDVAPSASITQIYKAA